MGRNTALARGINKFSRSASVKRSGKWRFFSKGADGKKTAPKAKAGPAPTASRWYQGDKSASAPRQRRRKKTAKLRASISPGTVLIVLAGRFRGKRVVFLKQLASGLLLVTGPFKVNGVPLRRLNQAYVLATSTRVSLDGVEVAERINDAYFARVGDSSASGTDAEGEFFAAEKKTVAIAQGRKDDQKAVDSALLKNVAKVPALRAYLNAKFSLRNGDAPHEMAF